MIVNTNVKLNFGLNVLRKREDGFHDIETLFVPYDGYGDTLEIISADDYSRTSARLSARYSEDMVAQGISPDGKLMITIAREEGIDWDPLEDLSAKAFFLLDKEFGLPSTKIFLEKRAPVGAGLGGGSADAAASLVLLDSLYSLGLGKERLCAYASALGSDCAFFIHGTPMIGTLRGEVLEPFDVDLRDYILKVIVPEGVAVSTAEAYRGISPRIPREGERLKDVLKKPVEEWKGLLVNDFEKTVFLLHPELAAIKQSLYDSGAVYASMSGSGSSLFALYRK